MEDRGSPGESSRRALISILQLAYSGERAAGYAYDGDWKSVSSSAERARIRQIEEEEWEHRRLVGAMLTGLGAAPRPWREIRASLIGKALGLLCRVSPWLLPMYGAGRLESRNIGEYEDAARHAAGCGRGDLVDCLLTMAEVEWEHEAYFRARVEEHAWAKRIPMWARPPGKATIRTRE